MPHTHWDREWRYPLWENRMYLVHFMDELLDILEHQPDYRSFLLDGQTVAVLDYLQVRPEKRRRSRNLSPKAVFGWVPGTPCQTFTLSAERALCGIC